MLKIEVVKFEAQDVITTSISTPPVEEYPKELDDCVCPKFKCGFNEEGAFERKNGCNCETDIHWVTQELFPKMPPHLRRHISTIPAVCTAFLDR